MFTGIIEAVSEIRSIQQHADHKTVTIHRPNQFEDIRIGASIACDGICLTVIGFDTKVFAVQIMNETVKKSTAGSWKTGESLNLERALKLGDRLDGHWVQGHVDTASSLLETSKIKDAVYLKIALDSQYNGLVVPQGSIALNGVSLTIAELGSGWLQVALIGHTLENTNLSRKRSGEKLNLEFDILGKYLLRQNHASGISKEWLYEQGF